MPVTSIAKKTAMSALRGVLGKEVVIHDSDHHVVQHPCGRMVSVALESDRFVFGGQEHTGAVVVSIKRQGDELEPVCVSFALYAVVPEVLQNVTQPRSVVPHNPDVVGSHVLRA